MQLAKMLIALILLLTSSFAFAHGVSDGMVTVILVVLSIAITFAEGILILFLRWAKSFKHQWLVIVFWVISLLSVFVWLCAVFGLANGISDLVRSDKWIALSLFILMIINFIIIIWTYKIPKKQYQDLQGQEVIATSSINEALGIKDNEG